MHEEDIVEIRIDFRHGEGDPTRVFRAMTGLIESTQRLDEHFSAMISTRVRTALVLQDIEARSLRAKLKTIVQEVPDEALKKGDVRRIVGHFLHKAKHRVIDWCSQRDQIKDRSEVKQLEADIHELAARADVNLLPAYTPVETATLLSDITSINNSLEHLSEGELATFNSGEGQSTYNPRLSISEAVVREIITRESIVTESERILKVKKPDYLGPSKWGFKYAGHLVDAKVLDEEWLNDFQGRNVSVQPGDSLRVMLKEELSYGYDSEIVHAEYEIVKVLEVIRSPTFIQGELFE